jgi:hypothetical protein
MEGSRRHLGSPEEKSIHSVSAVDPDHWAASLTKKKLRCNAPRRSMILTLQ